MSNPRTKLRHTRQLALDQDRVAWAKQFREHIEQFEWFSYYRDLRSSRTVRAVSSFFKVDYKVVLTAANRWGWAQRVDAYDAHIDATYLTRRELDIMGMRDRHLMQSVDIQAQLANKIKGLKPEDIRTEDIPKWLETAVRIERMAMGESTSNVAHHITGGVDVNVSTLDISYLNDAELEVLEKLVARIERRKSAVALPSPTAAE